MSHQFSDGVSPSPDITLQAPAVAPETSGDTTHSDNLRGSLFMVTSMAGFAINDAIMKLAGSELGIGQSLFVRGLFACVLVFIAAKLMGQWRSLKVLMDKALAVRTIGEMLATAAFVTALFNMPIANATAILQALPLAITLAAAFFWHEEIGWRRMIAILVGFSGVLIIVRPGFAGFNAYSVLVVIAVAACVVRDMFTRSVNEETPAMMIAFTTAIAVTVMGAVMTVFQGWNPVPSASLVGFAGSSVALVIGYYFIVLAMRKGSVGFVSPFRYTILLFSIILGWLLFGNLPDTWTLVGSAIVVGAGIYTLHRERRVRMQAITPPPQR